MNTSTKYWLENYDVKKRDALAKKLGGTYRDKISVSNNTMDPREYELTPSNGQNVL